MKSSLIYIIYLNQNNLYEWTMVQYISTGRFKWLTHDEINKFDVNKIQDSEEVLEVNLEYQEELTELHNGYTLAPEIILVKESVLSIYCRSILKNIIF